MRFRRIVKKLEVKTFNKTHIPENPMHEALKRLIAAIKNNERLQAEAAEFEVFTILESIK